MENIPDRNDDRRLQEIRSAISKGEYETADKMIAAIEIMLDELSPCTGPGVDESRVNRRPVHPHIILGQGDNRREYTLQSVTPPLSPPLLRIARRIMRSLATAWKGVRRAMRGGKV